MKALILCFSLVASAVGADSRLEGARQALDDGLPQVAIYKLRQALGKKLPERRPERGGNAAGPGVVRR